MRTHITSSTLITVLLASCGTGPGVMGGSDVISPSHTVTPASFEEDSLTFQSHYNTDVDIHVSGATPSGQRRVVIGGCGSYVGDMQYVDVYLPGRLMLIRELYEQGSEKEHCHVALSILTMCSAEAFRFEGRQLILQFTRGGFNIAGPDRGEDGIGCAVD